MKTKQLSVLLVSTALTVALVSCSKTDTTTTTTPVIPVSNPINSDTVPAFAKGTLLAGKTYTVTTDITVKAGDSLIAQPGAKVIVKSNKQFNILGVLQLVGTQAQPIFFNSDSNTPGSWGGFQCDSAKAVTIQWVHIDNTGGADPTGSPRKTIYVNAPINVDVEDSWITNGQDDILRFQGGCKLTVLRNSIISSGSTDGEAINIKSGATGDVAYNVVYSQSGTGIKLETSKLAPFPQTVINVYNNTLVANGWRRGAAEPGRGISVGLNAIGKIYNNIIVNCYQGIEIFTDADTVNTKHDYNLLYSSVDTYSDTTVKPNISINLRSNFFPGDGVGRPSPYELISKATNNLSPMFASFDGKVATANGAPTSNDFHLQAGSPALGKGYATYNVDMGAYTSDGKGNKH